MVFSTNVYAKTSNYTTRNSKTCKCKKNIVQYFGMQRIFHILVLTWAVAMVLVLHADTCQHI